MIPKLFSSTAKEFTTNGIGPLADAISCVVTEERNGIFELEMEYPIDGLHFSDIAEDKIIVASASDDTYYDGTHNQAFRIYKISRPINGVVTIYAEHISYLLSKMVVMPFEVKNVNVATALDAIVSNAAGYGQSNPFPFTFSPINKTTVGSLKVEEPKAIRNLLGGETGSVLDAFDGGEYKFDNFRVYLYSSRGSDNGVVLRYGKNLTDLKRDTDISNAYVGIVPYWKGSEYDDETSEQSDILVTLSEKVIFNQSHVPDYAYAIVKPVDFSSDFDDPPTESELRTKATSYLANNSGWKVNENIDVSFINLADTAEFQAYGYANLQHVNLCDTIKVIYEKLGVETTAKIVKTEWNSLLDRYNSLEIGESKTNLGGYISGEIDESSQKTSESASADMDKKIADAWKSFEDEMEQTARDQAELITGALGGYVVLHDSDNDGYPDEILIMEKPSISQSNKIIRMNQGGIAFSTTGYAPNKFKTAWTINGVFSADYITSGTLDASKATISNLQVGSITGLLSLNNGWSIDMNNGTITTGSISVGGKTSVTGKGSKLPGLYAGANGIACGRMDYYNPPNSVSESDRYWVNAFRIDGGDSSSPGIAYARNLKFMAWPDSEIDKNTPGDARNDYVSDYGLWCDKQKRIATGGGLHTQANKNLTQDNFFEGHTVMRTAHVWKTLTVSDEEEDDGQLTVYGDIDATGSITPNVNPSDENLKTDIRSISEEEAIRFIMAQDPVEFRWKDVEANKLQDKNALRHGLIAQRVQATNPEWNVVGESSKGLGLRYIDMIADLIKVVQHQEKEIAVLKLLIKVQGGED